MSFRVLQYPDVSSPTILVQSLNGSYTTFQTLVQKAMDGVAS